MATKKKKAPAKKSTAKKPADKKKSAEKKPAAKKKSEEGLSADFDSSLFAPATSVKDSEKQAKDELTESYRCKELINKYKSIAVYGMSKDKEKPSHYVPAYFIEHNYNIMPINPKAGGIMGLTSKKIEGLKVSKTLMEVEGEIEILDVFRPSQDAVGVVKEAIERNKEKGDIKVIWLQEGIVNDEARLMAEEAGFEFVQDRCIYKEFVKILPEKK